MSIVKGFLDVVHDLELFQYQFIFSEKAAKYC